MTESTADVSDIEAQIRANIEKSLSEIPHPSQAAGTSIYGSTKIFPDYRAEDGESYFTLIHGIPHESSVSFVAILGAAGFRSVSGVMMMPLHMEFGWSHGTIGTAMAINMTLFGLMSPFAAALMDRFGIRPVVTAALLLVAVGSGLTVFMTASWQLLLLWGVCVRSHLKIYLSDISFFDGPEPDRLRDPRHGQPRSPFGL